MLAILATTRTDINTALNAVQGRAHARTLDLSDILAIARRAVRQGYATTGRESVSSSYRYPADATAADAIRVNGHVYIAIDRAYAGSPSPWRLSAIGTRWYPETVGRHLIRHAPAVDVVRDYPGVIRIAVRGLRAGRATTSDRTMRTLVAAAIAAE